MHSSIAGGLLSSRRLVIPHVILCLEVQVAQAMVVKAVVEVVEALGVVILGKPNSQIIAMMV